MTRLFQFFDNYGDSFKASDTTSPAAERNFIKRTGSPAKSHFRIGRFSIAIDIFGDVWAAKFYDDEFTPGTILESKWRESHIKDRSSQHARALCNLHPTHPHFADINAAIKAERATWVL